MPALPTGPKLGGQSGLRRGRHGLSLGSDRLGIFSCVFLHLGLSVHDLLTFGGALVSFAAAVRPRLQNEELSDTARGI